MKSQTNTRRGPGRSWGYVCAHARGLGCDKLAQKVTQSRLSDVQNRVSTLKKTKGKPPRESAQWAGGCGRERSPAPVPLAAHVGSSWPSTWTIYSKSDAYAQGRVRALRVHWAVEMGHWGRQGAGSSTDSPGNRTPHPAYTGGPQGGRLDHVYACAMTSQPAQPAHGTCRLLAGQAGSGGPVCEVGLVRGVFDARARRVLVMSLS